LKGCLHASTAHMSRQWRLPQASRDAGTPWWARKVRMLNKRKGKGEKEKRSLTSEVRWWLPSKSSILWYNDDCFFLSKHRHWTWSANKPQIHGIFPIWNTFGGITFRGATFLCHGASLPVQRWSLRKFFLGRESFTGLLKDFSLKFSSIDLNFPNFHHWRKVILCIGCLRELRLLCEKCFRWKGKWSKQTL